MIYYHSQMEEIEKIKQQFDISALGFLPAAPLPETPNPLWEDLAQNLATKKVSENLDNLPEFTWHEPKRAYALLSILENKYFYETKSKTLPAKIAVPLWQVSQQLGIKPTLTHASVDLFNWSYINGTDFNLENLKTFYTLSPYTKDESWFYLITTAIEGIGAPILEALINFTLYPSDPAAYATLTVIYNTLLKMTDIMRRMYDNCRQEIFYNEIRHYLGGPTNVNYESIPELQNVTYKGGSGAQSTLIACIDKALGVEHESGYFTEILEYMPAKHRQFIKYVEENVTAQIAYRTRKTNKMYNKCIRALVQYRETHKLLIKKYINRFESADGAKGTGGTEIKTFIDASIKETTKLFSLLKEQQ